MAGVPTLIAWISVCAPLLPAVSISQDVLAKGITIRSHKPTNTIFIRHYQADLERIKKLIREQLDIPLPQVKIEARMEILDRTALEAIGVQWGGAAAGNTKNTTLVGQGFQSAPSTVPGMTLPAVGGVLQPDGSTIVTSPTGVQGVQPRNSNLNLNRLLPVDTFTGLPIGGNLVNIPFQSLPNASSFTPAGGIAFGIVGTNFNINLALERKFRFMHYLWAWRFGFNNLTNNGNPNVVNNNIDSPMFLTYGRGQVRAFAVRLRFLGKK